MNIDPNKPSEGLGDTIAKVTNFLGLDRVADVVAKLAGKEDCGCQERKDYLNQLFPYETTVRKFKFLQDAIIEGIEYRKDQIIEIRKDSNLFSRTLILTEQKIIEEIDI